MTISVKGKALVTGASSGIGAIYADRLARRGHDLILVARNRERLAGLAIGLASDTGRLVEVVVADLARRSDLARIEQILRTDSGITFLVNSAGIGGARSLLSSDVDEMERLLALNVTALMRLTSAAAAAFTRQGGGAIINIASYAAIAPELLNGVYGASKAFVLALGQSLQNELAGSNIHVQTVVPGATETDFWRQAGMARSRLSSDTMMMAEAMVDAGFAGFDQGETITIPSLPDMADWEAYEAARKTLIPNLSRGSPAARYGTG